MNVEEVMNRDVISVTPDTSVMEVARILMENRISGVPVVQEDELIGIITEKDLIDRVKKVHMPTVWTILDAWFAFSGERQFEDDLRKIASKTAVDIMTPDPFVVELETSLQEAATIISENNYSLLPVMADNKMVGIIGKRDIIRGMLMDNDQDGAET